MIVCLKTCEILKLGMEKYLNPIKQTEKEKKNQSKKQKTKNTTKRLNKKVEMTKIIKKDFFHFKSDRIVNRIYHLEENNLIYVESDDESSSLIHFNQKEEKIFLMEFDKGIKIISCTFLKRSNKKDEKKEKEISLKKTEFNKLDSNFYSSFFQGEKSKKKILIGTNIGSVYSISINKDNSLNAKKKILKEVSFLNENNKNEKVINIFCLKENKNTNFSSLFNKISNVNRKKIVNDCLLFVGSEGNLIFFFTQNKSLIKKKFKVSNQIEHSRFNNNNLFYISSGKIMKINLFQKFSEKKNFPENNFTENLIPETIQSSSFLHASCLPFATNALELLFFSPLFLSILFSNGKIVFLNFQNCFVDSFHHNHLLLNKHSTTDVSSLLQNISSLSSQLEKLKSLQVN